MIEKKINGNVSGVRDTTLDELLKIYDLKSRNQIVSEEISGIMCQVSSYINREICVMISRDGSIVDVSIGDSSSVALKSINTTHSQTGLCGVRCVHTHPNGSGMLSSVDVGSLISGKYDAMVAIGVEHGKAKEVSIGILNKKEEEEIVPQIYGMFKVHAMPNDALFDEIREAIVLARGEDYVEEDERAILIGIDDVKKYDSLKELKKLCENAGLNVINVVRQKREVPDKAFYVGKGKVEEISLQCSADRIDVAVCDDELSSHQVKNLEEILGVKVIDRTALILDIFAKRATTREGKLQVELAQQRYRLPRLQGMGKVLSRLGGGIGTRGPGEKKLEIDQRHIRKRIGDLEKTIKELEVQRDLRRKQIKQNDVPVVALVGYTNAGKSTLLNRLSGADVFAKDKLFATLDPVTRKVNYGFDFLVSDTVGFINKLPHDLISAFKSTLEQAKYADLILHVVDSSSDYAKVQMEVVNSILEELEIRDIPVVMVYNKIDSCILDKDNFEENSVQISAKNDIGIDELLKAIERNLFSKYVDVEVVIPYAKGNLQAIVRKGVVLSEEYTEEGIYFKAQLKQKEADMLKSMLGEN